ncbi:hypothetical protein HSE3_gp101 [Bacillus phage vB_BceM-HSE3]|nr:hypothetical protein HSE3_gp101 [Bacillus phage vB_BceM-HSE3]
MDELSRILVPLIGLGFLSLLIDKLTFYLQEVIHKVPRLPDQFEFYIAYSIVFIISFIICWRGQFDIFSYLGMKFQPLEGYLFTALVLSGGSRMVTQAYAMTEKLPSAIDGLKSLIKKK